MTSSDGGSPEPAAGRRWIQDFSEGSREQRALLGGKGANLAEMVGVLGPDLVPAGFTITTDACRAFLEGRGSLPDGLEDEVSEAVARLEESAGRRFGDPGDPLLLSVRSGARDSMPGMMDTVLDIGLNDESVVGLAARSGDERFAWDSYRRLIQMYGNVVMGIPSERFEEILDRVREVAGAGNDADLDAEALKGAVREFREIVDFPQDPRAQLDGAIRAVFSSWNGDRAIAYRRIHGIPDEWGTAANVQQMVFGNLGEDSCSGVAFSRDEVTGAAGASGDFLINAQGEDVVSGARTPLDLDELASVMPDIYPQLLEALRKLERHFEDMQDTEFTVEDGRLYMLQTRNAKRPAQAALRFAVDAVDEGLLDRRQALVTIDASGLEALLHPTFDPAFDYSVLTTGVAASPGAASGAIVLDAASAIARAGEVRIGDLVLGVGDYLAINGTTGEVTTDEVPLVDPEVGPEFEEVLGWCPEIQRMEVRANADSGEEARVARGMGATGIGLCRTEHMFLGERQPLMADVILAHGVEERERRLEVLRELQEADFGEIFEAMEGFPVTIRLLDPPLHEFLPRPESLEPGEMRDRIEALQEVNPMLGLRGVRLGILYPEIYRMQARAIFSAVVKARDRLGTLPRVEVMVPLIAYAREFDLAREVVDEVAAGFDLTVGSDYHVGTMIELPRACLRAADIARQAEFFSFGTNDLTQTTLGFSRDDIEGRILSGYIRSGVMGRSPFETIDVAGVGALIEIAVERGREANPGLGLGACGEHAGEPSSIEFFEGIGLDYVSCSPFRVPVARVAAAQAAIATDPLRDTKSGRR